MSLVGCASHLRHAHELWFMAPKIEEAKRFAATNAETLTSPSVALNAFFNIYQFHVQSIWNLIETGVSVGRDEREIKRQKRFSSRTSRAQMISLAFSYSSRVTIMPSVSAFYEIIPSLYIFEGAEIPCQVFWRME